MKDALIMAGGAVGSLLRYILQGWGQALTSGTFPLGTLGVNVIGCFVIGFLNFLFTGPWPIRADYRIGLLVGVLGGAGEGARDSVPGERFVVRVTCRRLTGTCRSFACSTPPARPAVCFAG